MDVVIQDFRPITVFVDVESCRLPRIEDQFYDVNLLVPAIRGFLRTQGYFGFLNLFVVVGEANNPYRIHPNHAQALEDLEVAAQNAEGFTMEFIDVNSPAQGAADEEIKARMVDWMDNTEIGLIVLASCDGGYRHHIEDINQLYHQAHRQLDLFLLHQHDSTAEWLLDFFPGSRRAIWDEVLFHHLGAAALAPPPLGRGGPAGGPGLGGRGLGRGRGPGRGGRGLGLGRGLGGRGLGLGRGRGGLGQGPADILGALNLGICGPKALNQNLILSESEALDDHPCSETDESPSWYCTLCPDITGKGFESFTSHLSSTRHLLERSYSLPVRGNVIMDKLAYEDKNPPTIVRKQPEKATPEEAVAGTLVFWDINLFPIPLGFDARRVSLCIKHFLETYGYSGPLAVYAVGILTDVPAIIREALSSSGITLCENFHGFTDMSQLMSDVLSCYQPPANIMGICDPRSFPLPLVGHNTFRPFSYLSPLQDAFLWENSLLAGETTSKSVAHADIVGASTMGRKQPNGKVKKLKTLLGHPQWGGSNQTERSRN